MNYIPRQLLRTRHQYNPLLKDSYPADRLIGDNSTVRAIANNPTEGMRGIYITDRMNSENSY